MVRETATMKGVHTGVSQALQIRVAKRAHTAPCEALIILPSKDAGRQQMKKRWRPLLTGKGCPVLRQFQRRRRATGRPRKNGTSPGASSRAAEEIDRTTYDNIVLTNGFDLLLGYSGSVHSLASNACEEVEMDEVDNFNDWDGDEASPVELGRVRTETFQETYKLNQVSTPTVDSGNIALAFDASGYCPTLLEDRYHAASTSPRHPAASDSCCPCARRGGQSAIVGGVVARP